MATLTNEQEGDLNSETCPTHAGAIPASVYGMRQPLPSGVHVAVPTSSPSGIAFGGVCGGAESVKRQLSEAALLLQAHCRSFQFDVLLPGAFSTTYGQSDCFTLKKPK